MCVGGATHEHRDGDLGADAPGGRAVARMLELNYNLTSMQLEWNQLGATSGRAIGRALRDNNCLTYLNLAYNAIATEGAERLSPQK